LLAVGAVDVGTPEDVGLSTDRLKRIGDVFRRYIDEQQVAGGISLVARKGRIVHFETHGLMDIETKMPMRRDAIFRMASMTKPVTGVAILMLVEEGKVRLTDPVSRFIPEFKDMKVAMAKPGSARPSAPGAPPPPPEIYTVPALREITVRDLLTHTAGLQSGGLGSREAARIATREGTDTLATHIPRLGRVPLDFQPGTEWRYSGLAGIDTLGRIVEVASGLTFDRFLKERLFDPLGMKDTAFYPAEAQMARVATLYRRANGRLERQDTPVWLATKTLFSGGAGLWSTAEDYARFAQMLVNGGELDGTRILGPRTVELMAANHVGDLYEKAGPTRRGMGFGLTVEVVLDPVAANRRTSKGSYGWDGAFGTHFWVDPEEELTGILLIQQALNATLNRDFENAVMQAIVD
jgi:CubicO group peptidase (beta-lactamase class C family)